MFTTRVRKILADDSGLEFGSSVCYPEAESGCAFVLQIEASSPRARARALINLRQRKIVRGLLRTTAEASITLVADADVGHYEIEVGHDESCVAHVVNYEPEHAGRMGRFITGEAHFACDLESGEHFRIPLRRDSVNAAEGKEDLTSLIIASTLTKLTGAFLNFFHN